MIRSSERPRRKAVIADDHPMVRASIRSVLESLDDIEVTEEVDNGLDAVRAARTVEPALFVLDLTMPHSGGLEVFAEIRRQSPKTRIAVVTGLTSASVLGDLMAAGVDGLFLKRGDLDAMARGLRLVIDGAKFIAPEVVELLKQRPAARELSMRERQTLGLIAQGYTNAQIGDRLNLSPKTIEKHRGSLMSKLGVNSLAQLLAHALREGLLDGSRQD